MPLRKRTNLGRKTISALRTKLTRAALSQADRDKMYKAMREYQALIKSRETPEEREKRLRRQREYQALKRCLQRKAARTKAVKLELESDTLNKTQQQPQSKLKRQSYVESDHKKHALEGRQMPVEIDPLGLLAERIVHSNTNINSVRMTRQACSRRCCLVEEVAHRTK